MVHCELDLHVSSITILDLELLNVKPFFSLRVDLGTSLSTCLSVRLSVVLANLVCIYTTLKFSTKLSDKSQTQAQLRIPCHFAHAWAFLTVSNGAYQDKHII